MPTFFLLMLLFVVPPQFQIRPFGPSEFDAYSKMSAVPSTFQLMFILNEVMDPREARYIFHKQEDFVGDMRMITNRMIDLKDAPYVHECYLLPERVFINELLLRNREYLQYLDEAINKVWIRDPIYAATKEETNYLYKLWDNARDARCDYYYIHVRRQALKYVKTELDKIDPTWYFSGKMPPHVPLWRFNEIR
jgi:hypothetical protein